MWEAVSVGDQVWQGGVTWLVTAKVGPTFTFKARDGRVITTIPRAGSVPTVLAPDDPRYQAADPELAVALIQVRLGGRVIGSKREDGVWIIPTSHDIESHKIIFHHEDGTDAAPHIHETE